MKPTHLTADLLTRGGIVFTYRGVECWTKEIKQKNSPYRHSCNGYFRLFVPDVHDYDMFTSLFLKHDGEHALPNGGRFTYLVKTGVEDEVVVGFDGAHEHNKKKPLFREEARQQIERAVDFILDNGFGFVFSQRVQA